QSLAQRACLDSNLKLAGWSEGPSGMALAQRDFARPARNPASGFSWSSLIIVTKANIP
ncbi:hypothetical protein A2U01_0051414, partial [Trifolium medium]|nr:hypothetical protein [Trifolium medium]